MQYSIETLKSYIADDIELDALLTNMSREFFYKTWLIESTFSIIDDNAVVKIDKNNMIALAKMLRSYSNRCWHIAVDEVDLVKLLKYHVEEVYYTKVFEGSRISTVGEIANGVKGLEIHSKERISDDVYKKLCLLQWTFDGRYYYYRQAGYEVTYDSNGKVKEDFYTLVKRAAYGLVELFDWLENDNEYDEAIKVLTKASKMKPYKYPTYAKDEVVEDISIKTLFNSAKKTIKKGTDNPDYRRAIHLLIKSDKTKLEPIEISFIRTTYEKFLTDVSMQGILEEERANRETEVNLLKEKCERLLNERYSGKINSEHFVYKVISTVKGKHYTRCSEKQMDIIDQALEIIKIKSNNVEGDSNKDESNGTGDSKALGNGTRAEVISDFDIDRSLESLNDVFSGDMFG